MKAKHLLLVMVISVLPLTIMAEQREYTDANKVVYTYDTNGITASVKSGKEGGAGLLADAGCPEAEGDIVIPSQIEVDGKVYKVTEIGRDAFAYNLYITSVDIAEGVQTLRKNCFWYCRNMAWIRLPQSVNKIEMSAFSVCEKLQSIDLPEGLTIIEKNTFAKCKGLKSIKLPSSLKTLSASAYDDCTGLTSIFIPQNLSSYNGSFVGCSGIETIAVDERNQWYDSREDCNAIVETATNKLLLGCKNTVIPKTVTCLGNICFAGVDINEMVVPDHIKIIEAGVFSSCKNLKSVVTSVY